MATALGPRVSSLVKMYDPHGVVPLLEDAVASFGGTPRSGQIEMATAVADALAGESGHQLMVEAGTGTGKSLAYLAGIAAAADEDRRCVIVTATKALQAQLDHKDLPVAERTLDVSATKLVGMSNYVCRAKLLEGATIAETQVGLFGDEDDDADDDLRIELSRYLAANPHHSGERDDLPFEIDGRQWSEVSVAAAECTAKSCSHADRCFGLAARQSTLDANVVIANAALYAAHLAVVDEGAPDGLLGHHDQLVIDEVHRFGDAIRSALTATVPLNPMTAAYNAYASLIDTDVDDLERARDLNRRLEATVAPYRGERLTEVPEDLSDALADLRTVIASWKQVVAKVDTDANPAVADRKARVLKVLTGRHDLFDSVAPEDGSVLWCDDDGQLHATPLEVGEWLRTRLWPNVAAVGCSATVPSTIARDLGLPNATEIEVASPFDYPSQGLLYVPKMPSPKHTNRDAHEAAVAEEVGNLIEWADGRTISLHTSRRGMRFTADYLTERFEGRRDIVIYDQDELPRTELMARVANDPGTCLVATQGLWEGISIDGDSVLVVTIDRLPFAPPTDPVEQARHQAAEAAGLNSFATLTLPAAAQMLAQGVGRLIRTTDDRGVVAVLDPRLAEARYRGTILDRLPALTRTREPQVVEAALDAFVADPEARVVTDGRKVVIGTYQGIR